MKKFLLAVIILFGLVLTGCNNKREGDPKVLVFSNTMGFKHASIPAAIAAIQKLGAENGFAVDTTKNAELFNDENLKQYSAVIFMSTTGNVLDHRQEAAFERYIQAGGGYVGIHAAADTEYDWGWYNKLAGAQFESHPSGTPEADFIIRDFGFVATKHFTDSVWHRTDELYNYKSINPDVNVLMTLDESTYEGGTNGDFHPIAWYHEFDGGRAFYTGAGHTEESYTEENFLKHLLGGIQYAIGDNKILDYEKATTQIPPDIDRFSKVTLVEGEFFEPTEMAILPNNDVLISQRRGEIMLYKDDTKELKEIAVLDVYHKTLNTPGVNAEEGVMGLQKDPDYTNNHWIYVYYAPTGEKWVNRLSRFKYQDGNFDLASEQVILEVDSQREICCHTGGSIAFGPDDLLYLSTGDNSTPFNEKNVKYVNNGYAPLNDLPGKEQYDARRSSGNTNDLRGKILRIKVNEDGSYDIPEGNLFPMGTEKTRPEIYTMGHRNPYRISVDVKRGYVYWGDVGPDARADSIGTRGPRGYDEMNQARSAGNFGWPLFIGDNKPYNDYDYATGESGPAFDPEKPINDSKNNTGLRELPPAQPAYVYYPYVETGDFPQVGTGGRNAMAGPTYYSDLYPNGGGLPSYYDGKVIIYDWMRGWMMAVTLFEDGTFNKMEPFASDIKLNNLIDMEMGPDGRVYLLEYGSGWFSQNDDSGLSYIEYNGGNRPPLIDNLIVDRTSGKLPLTVTAKVEARDREGDPVRYLWDLGNGETRETSEPEITHTYDQAGDYKVFVEVKDDKGASAKSTMTSIVAGNSRPELSIDLSGGNSSFFIAGTPVKYKVSVSDPDDNAAIDDDNVFVSVDYMEGMDEVNKSLGHQQVSAAITGKALTQAMDCKTCHKEAEASIGPTYLAIAEKYKGQRNALGYLQKKIVAGGTGVWGEVMMPAHPNVTSDESRQMALYIQSLVDTGERKKSLPLAGTIIPDPSPTDNVMVLTASYTDEGSDGAGPLTGMASVTLRGSTVPFSGSDKVEGFSPIEFGGMKLLMVPSGEGWFALDDIDLKGVNSVMITAGWQEPPKVGLDMEMRLNAPDGELLGSGSMPAPVAGQPGGMVMINLEKPTEIKAKEIYFVHKPKEGEEVGQMAFLNVKFNGK
ncbi:PKD domain-containing protein [Flavobacteriaceae bacterium TP-CH-4]|uniref:PKD domain-containing protein n=1 Tax=Pelagihabitans pacificus TaxID=2696054 RepID=A0A967ASF8_9FLAO|nr:ThuA domain-containing protein [Pelagihabitans pacificus]NHF59438.1 PKD domain-containing protein [Pelagihabitans pacificus]